MATELEGRARVAKEPAQQARGTRAQAQAAARSASSSPSTDHDAYQAQRHFSSLDGLRCLCITAVIWHHTGPRWDFLPGSQRGFLGVDMFFVISGYLIVTLLLRERDRTGGISLKHFYVRRTLRIFPIYYLTLLAMALIFGVLSTDSPRSPAFFAELPYYLTYTSNWIDAMVLPLTWSLATEEQFYLLWPAIERFARRYALPILAALLVLSQWMNFARGSAYFDAVLGPAHEGLAVLQVTFTPILLGVGLAHMLHSPSGFERFRRALAGSYAPAVWMALLIALANVPNPDISGFHRLGLQLLMTGLIGSVVALDVHVLRRLFTLNAIKRIGIASYGMYLYHVFTQHVAEAALYRIGLESRIANFALCFVLTWIMAELSYRWFEARFLRLKARFAVV